MLVMAEGHLVDAVCLSEGNSPGWAGDWLDERGAQAVPARCSSLVVQSWQRN